MILLIFIYSSIHSFIWLHWVLVAAFRTFDLRCRTCDLSVAACRIFSSGMQTISSSMWDLVPCPGIKPRPPALGAQSLSHWTTRKSSHWQLFPVLTSIPRQPLTTFCLLGVAFSGHFVQMESSNIYHTICGFCVWLLSFSIDVFEVYPYCSMYQYSTPFIAEYSIIWIL